MMAQDYSAILRRFDGVRAYKWGWKAKCPAHDDQNPSLTIRVGADGGLLVKCQAGCGFEQVVDKANCAIRDFMAPRKDDYGMAADRRIKASYDYRDEQDKLLYQVVRWEPKGFSCRRPDKDGAWTWEMNGTRRVLYRLPEIVGSQRGVLVTEGEKAVDRLAALGFVATCNPHGAGPGKWHDDYSKVLAGRAVVLLPHVDPVDPKRGTRPGEEHMRLVALSLLPVVKSLQVIWLPGLVEGQDTDDWLDAGNTPKQLKLLIKEAAEIKTVAELEAACKQPDWTVVAGAVVAGQADVQQPAPVVESDGDVIRKAILATAVALSNASETLTPAEWCVCATESVRELTKLVANELVDRKGLRNE